jgi:hypothetical protein
LRKRGEGDKGTAAFDTFVVELLKEIHTKA